MVFGSRTRPAGSAASALLLTLLACGGLNRLGEYDFSDGTLAVAADVPARPEVLTGPLFFADADDPIRTLIRAGARIATEVQASEAREKLDEAAEQADVASRLSQRSLERTARSLGATVSEDLDRADFILEVTVREYGIDAENWEAAAHFFIDADIYLIEGPTGVGIWESKVHERDRITPVLIGVGSTAREVVTAGYLASLSVEEITRALEQLADYSADRVADRLRDGLRDAR
jgi:hypothetical protein